MPIKLLGSTSGYLILDAPAIANNATLTLPQSANGAFITTGDINTFTRPQIIEVADDATAALRITQTGTGEAIRVEDDTNPDSTPFVVNALGEVGIGTTAPFRAIDVVREATGSTLRLTTYADSSAPTVDLRRATGTISAPTAIGTGQAIGYSDYFGYDGSNFVHAARIAAIVDGTPGTNDMPGRLVFYTTADGASSPTERMRIASAGNVGIGITNPQTKLGFASGSSISWGSSNYPYISGDSSSNFIAFGTQATERMRIDSNGKVLIGINSTFIGANMLQIASSIGEQIAIRHTSAATNRCWRIVADENNTVYVVNENTVGVYIGHGGTSWVGLSDERTKDIIEPITDAVNKVSGLRAVIGKYKTDEEEKRRSFLIAQDVQAVLPEAVSVANQETGHLGLAYTEVIPLLVAAIKELTERVKILESK